MPSLTQVWRNASYPAIDPTKASLSVASKTVFVTGGGAGIGLATARAFAAAGASIVAISGRTEKTLRAAKGTSKLHTPELKSSPSLPMSPTRKLSTPRFQP